jgi:hypothetical protein
MRTTTWTAVTWCGAATHLGGEHRRGAAGHEDTFHYTNAAPQAAAFNQGQTLWAGLENYLLDNAATYDRRLIVLTGPVLAPGDPPYRGTQMPLRFWKATAFLDPAASAAGAPLLAATRVRPGPDRAAAGPARPVRRRGRPRPAATARPGPTRSPSPTSPP